MKNFLFSFVILWLLISLNACQAQATKSGDQAKSAEEKIPDSELVGGISIATLDEQYKDFEKAYFAGGCFWCVEAAFERIIGVEAAISGYAGGEEINPSYQLTGTGRTNHAETVVVYYDPKQIDYPTLLDVFFTAHDPTQLNRQGPDVGPEYRSAIFYLSDEQKLSAVRKIAALDRSGKFKDPIVTELSAAGRFWVAEAYHQDYYEDPSNPNQGYVQNVSRPKVEKVMATFPNLLKPKYRNSGQ